MSDHDSTTADDGDEGVREATDGGDEGVRDATDGGDWDGTDASAGRDADDLHRLVPDGRRLVGEAFLRGETRLADEAVAPFVEPVAHDGDVDLAAVDEAVSRIVSEYDAYDTAVDGELAPTIHRALDVSRRVAADPGVWHWLAVVRFPAFVRHRWQFSSETAMREKFLGAGTDLYSNALHRLWWIAELTHEGDDYARTRGVFDNQTVVNKVFDRWFARYEPAVQVLCDELEGRSSSTVDEVTNRLNHVLTNVQLEGMDREDVRRLVRELVAEADAESLDQFEGSSSRNS